MTNNKYYKPNVNMEWIRKSPFRHSGTLSTYEENVYTYKFPVYKSGNTYTLECEIILFENSGQVVLNVYDCSSKNKYTPFYSDYYGKNEVVISIHKRIDKEMCKLGIRRKRGKKR